MIKRLFSFVLAIALLYVLLPQFGVKTQAASYILDPEAADGFAYSSVYGEKLNNIFRGEVNLFSNSAVRYPLGTSMQNSASYSVAGAITGSQCYIYAQAVYYYLFGDVVYHGDGAKYWSDSTKVLYNVPAASFDVFRDAKVGFGAYIRTTDKSNGEYNGSKGHSMIVLNYSEENITFLEGNADGKGLVRISVMTWAEYNNAMLAGKGRRISHVVQCDSVVCEHDRYTDTGTCVKCGYAFDFSATFDAGCAGSYLVTAKTGTSVKAQKPYDAADELCYLAADTPVEVLGCVTNLFAETWYQMSYDGNTGYAKAADLGKDTVTPGVPHVQYTASILDTEEAVFTWAATANTTHYEMLVDVSYRSGQWEEYLRLPNVTSGLALQLPEGEYRVQLWACNANAQVPGTDGYPHSSVEMYLTVSHKHDYSGQVITHASCDAAGIEELTCTICGDSYFREIPKTSHDYIGQYCIFCNARQPSVVELQVSLSQDTGKPVLNWNAVSGAKKYEVYRATSENGKYTKLTSITKRTYTDTKASAGTAYFYKVRVLSSKSAYNGKYSWAIGCRTACARPVVTGKADEATGYPSLSWKAVTGAARYRIYRIAPGEENAAVIAEQTGRTYLDKSAQVGVEYVYSVQALASRTESDSAASAQTRIKATYPCPVLKSAVNEQGKPVISWASVDGAASYKVYRSTSATKSYKLVKTVEDTAYIDTTASVGKTYYYKVIAAGEHGQSAYSGYVKADCKCAAPALKVENNASGKPALSWKKVSGAKKYEIYRSVNGGTFKKLTTTTKVSYTDSKATSGSACEYKVRALGSKSAFNSVFSQAEKCCVRCSAPTVTAKTEAKTGNPSLTWKKVTGAVKYEVYRSVASGEYESVSVQSGTTYVDAAVTAGVKYSYRVVALGAEEAFHSTAGKAVSVTAVCGSPALKGVIGNSGKPELHWEAVANADGYAVYRSTSASKGYKRIGKTADLSYTDLKAQKGKTYYYKVVALAGSTESAQSGYAKLKSK